MDEKKKQKKSKITTELLIMGGVKNNEDTFSMNRHVISYKNHNIYILHLLFEKYTMLKQLVI